METAPSGSDPGIYNNIRVGLCAFRHLLTPLEIGYGPGILLTTPETAGPTIGTFPAAFATVLTAPDAAFVTGARAPVTPPVAPPREPAAPATVLTTGAAAEPKSYTRQQTSRSMR